MTIRVKDKNRAELVKAIIRQNGGKIFTVVAKRKTPKRYFIVEELCPAAAESGSLSPLLKGISVGGKVYLSTKKAQSQLDDLLSCTDCKVTVHEENFMTMTCRTGVKKGLKGGQSTIAHKDDLISVNLTNGKGYRAFSAYNVLELRASGTVITFKEEDVLSFEGE